MDRDRSRVLALFVAYLVLVAVALFVMNWFVASMPFGTMSIDLRSAHICPDTGRCDNFSLSEMRGTGFYAPLGGLTFFGTLLFTLLVGYQAITRVTSGFVSETLSKLGYLGGMILFGTAFAAAFLFGPQASSLERETMQFEVSRTAAPFLLLIALLLGIIVLYYAVTQRNAEGIGEYKPLTDVPVVVKRITQPMEPIKKSESRPPISVLQKTKSSPPASALQSDPISVLPEHLRKKLKFVTLSAEITRAGIDARREDGSSKLVMWRDVVGIVARRMPPEHDALTFLDIVSVAGSTLRVLPWTRVTGETVAGEGDVFTRGLLDAMLAHCPEASLDPATKRFQSGEPAAQLKDTMKLAAHDEKLS
jgi:hypothetical protein